MSFIYLFTCCLINVCLSIHARTHADTRLWLFHKRGHLVWNVSSQFSPETLILGFRRYVDDICALLGYYGVSCGSNCLPTFRDILTGQESPIPSDLFIGIFNFLLLDYLYFIYLALSLYFPPLLLLYSYCTLLAVITPTDCYPAALSRIYVIGCWLCFLLGTLDTWRWDRHVVPKRRCWLCFLLGTLDTWRWDRHVVPKRRWRLCFLLGTLDTWRWDRHVVPKRRWTITTRVIPQKTADFIFSRYIFRFCRYVSKYMSLYVWLQVKWLLFCWNLIILKIKWAAVLTVISWCCPLWLTKRWWLRDCAWLCVCTRAVFEPYVRNGTCCA
jgi:hypothetical protein